MSNAEFYERLRDSDVFPTTAQPAPGAFVKAYEALSDYDDILVLTLSSEFSGTYDSALQAAEMVDRPVHVLDTRSAEMGSGLILLESLRCIDEGGDFDEVRRVSERAIGRANVLFAVGTLEYLAKSGRIGRAQRLLGTALDVRPVLKITGGEVAPFKRTRGRKRQMAAIVEEVGRPSRPGVRSTSGTSPLPNSSLSSRRTSGSRRGSSPRSAASSDPTSAWGPMAWPTSRAGDAPGVLLPARTTLTDLRSRPVTELPGVGPRIGSALGDLGIASLADMVSHYPSRHEDLSNVKRISDLRVGERATIFGTVVSTRPVGKPVRGRSPGFSVQLYDGTGYIPVTVWGRSWLLNQLLPEVRVVVSGEIQSR